MIGQQKKHSLQALISNQLDGSRQVKYLQPSIHEFTPLEILRQPVEQSYQPRMLQPSSQKSGNQHKKKPTIQFPKKIKNPKDNP